jgi:hypothetical protein
MAIILAALASSATAYLKGVFDAIIDDVLPKGASCEANIVLFCISYVFVKCSFSGRASVCVLPDQYSRLLQLLKAKGIFNNYSHSGNYILDVETDLG